MIPINKFRGYESSGLKDRAERKTPMTSVVHRLQSHFQRVAYLVVRGRLRRQPLSETVCSVM